MVFAYATDERSLQAFANPSDTVAHCEGADVAGGGWLFFAEDGSPLKAEFTVPAQAGRFVVAHGVYHLRPSGDGPDLREVLALVVSVEGQGLRSIEEVKRVLTPGTSGAPAASAERKR